MMLNITRIQCRSMTNSLGSCLPYPIPTISLSKTFKSSAQTIDIRSECRYAINFRDCQLKLGRLNSSGFSRRALLSSGLDGFKPVFLSNGVFYKSFCSNTGKGSRIMASTETTGVNKKTTVGDEKVADKPSLVELFRDSQCTRSKTACNDGIQLSIEKDAIEEDCSEKKRVVNGKSKKGTKTQGTRKDSKGSKIQDKTLQEEHALSNDTKAKGRKTSPKKKSRSTPSAKTKKLENASSQENTRTIKGNSSRLFPPSGKSVMVVESATKAKTIQNYLGDMFVVLPTYGHVRDLAGRSGSVRPDDDFSMVWEVPTSAWTHLKSIKVALGSAENLILATDPDREGEAIAWHLIEMLHQQDALKDGINVRRVVFHEITDVSIKNALQSPRDLDINLINAYLARRALDYLIGFNISPLLWRKLPGCQSAGRVQSAALALICDREMEIDQFKTQEYWTIEVQFHKADDNVLIPSELTHFDSKRLNQLSIRTNTEANSIQKRVSSSDFVVLGVKKKKMHRTPPIPYITSTLQQDSANKLHFTAAHTMKLAQKLYEGVILSDEQATGLITYMRTDGSHISDAAAKDIHSLVTQRYGQNYAPKSIRKYFKKVKNAQEAHEAIRPSSIWRLPSTLVGVLDEDSLKLYTLIWTRTVACQMESVCDDIVQVEISNSEKDIIFHSSGSKIAFPGYVAVYKDDEARAIELSDNEDTSKGEAFKVLSLLKKNDRLHLKNVECVQHHTKGPGRYSEGSLVKKLEELGIGRPSTYAQILRVLQARNYVTTKSRILNPVFRGRMVSAFLSHHFSEVSDYSFTADMETELDNVASGSTEWKGLLKDYWSRFKSYCDLAANVNIRQLEKMLEKKFGHILFCDIDGKSRTCPSCLEGNLVFKISRYGTGYFIGCDQHPKCKYISGAELSQDEDDMSTETRSYFDTKLIGHSPDTNEKIFVKKGPYGYYVQLGEDRKECPPKRAPLEGKDVNSLTIEDAIELLRYPITLGNHPIDESPVTLSHSKFGFSIRYKRFIAPVPKDKDPKKITLEAAVELLKSKNVKQTGRRKKTKDEEHIEGYALLGEA